MAEPGLQLAVLQLFIWWQCCDVYNDSHLELGYDHSLICSRMQTSMTRINSIHSMVKLLAKMELDVKEKLESERK